MSLLLAAGDRRRVLSASREKIQQSVVLVRHTLAMVDRCHNRLERSRLRVERSAYVEPRSIESGINEAVHAPSVCLLSETQYLCEAIKETYRKRQAMISKMQERTARQRLLLHEREKISKAAARSLVRRRLQDGRLPKDGGPVFAGSPGHGGHCAVCGATLTIRQLVMEVPTAGDRVYCLHADCFTLWSQEREKG